MVCGAGHLCCDDPSEPPSHDHFLRQDDCPRCAVLLAEWKESMTSELRSERDGSHK